MSADPLESVFEHREKIRKPGWRKALPWVTAITVVGVGIALLIIFVRNTGHSEATPLNPNVPAVDVSKIPKTVKLQPGAERVAREFIRTAVARTNLAAGYKVSGPQITEGQTLKQWMTGNIAVPPYPVSDLDFAPMKIDYSYPKTALIEVALLPKPKTGVKPAMFMMEIDKLNGQWKVNSWVPRSVPFVHSQGDEN